ncbi:MAG: succinylglutamate desuccinylase/aspartoacylase family protein [Flavobacteriales bacterium]|nr:succinylglutamate desuccinylase/aspartoacylase family protein [Flavobacteriales bacterium]
MTKARFYSKALDKHFEVERIIGEFHGEEDGPVLVFFGGIHGNESSGVVALIEVMEEIKRLKPKIKGSIYAITGNMNSLQKEQRFEKEDLNRIWTKDRMRRLEKGTFAESELNADEKEQLELFKIGKEIFKKHAHQVYCIDLHTTSAPTVPFITLNDTLINRDFATKFPVPVIIGIEEFLVGPLLSWVMEIGYPSLAFEAGEHFSEESIKFHKAFVWLSLVHGGLISEKEAPEFGKHHLILAASNADHGRIFEVYHRKGVSPEENFEMKPGYANLQPVVKGEKLASNVDGDIISPENGRVFMPLYQKQGNDGFFLAREVAPFWLALSARLRKWKFETVLTWLPGVRRDQKEKHTLIVNKSVAKFLAVEIFHLLGYRTKVRLENELRFTKREYDVRGVAQRQ